MYTYNPKSLRAQEFIHDGEIRETLAYAEANKNNTELIMPFLKRPGGTQPRCRCPRGRRRNMTRPLPPE